MLSDAEIEAELEKFEAVERRKLGLEVPKKEHWRDANPSLFRREERETTTLLVGGLTHAQDYFVHGALMGQGYRIDALDVPDQDALHLGKEFGNRGQCNPTYFTVGNLLKHLVRLRDEDGLSVQQIVDGYVFLTAGACGPCRFGTYATEYRKALRDAGFEGFRVLLFQQQGGLKQASGKENGLELNPRFFLAILKAILAGDVLNAMGYRIRPYETRVGETDRALAACREILHSALQRRRSVLRALLRCRRILRGIRVNRLQPKPKVSIIGEFWAMTTEGDGNYRLQKFLESEGAECDIQLVTAWLLYNFWQVRFDTRRRMTLRRDDEGRSGLEGKNAPRRLLVLWVAERLLRGVFHLYAKSIGLENYALSDMDELATISHQFYDNHLRGGEGHMEVGKLIKAAKDKKAHMVISVKPFGCMPSSGVSDGIQSLVTGKYPQALYCAIETTGDSAVNAQSRILLDLFKAKQAAVEEYDALLEKMGLTQEEAEVRLESHRTFRAALHYPRHSVAGTGANQLIELSRRHAPPSAS